MRDGVPVRNFKVARFWTGRASVETTKIMRPRIDLFLISFLMYISTLLGPEMCDVSCLDTFVSAAMTVSRSSNQSQQPGAFVESTHLVENQEKYLGTKRTRQIKPNDAKKRTPSESLPRELQTSKYISSLCRCALSWTQPG